jgi:hypothetical protein
LDVDGTAALLESRDAVAGCMFRNSGWPVAMLFAIGKSALLETVLLGLRSALFQISAVFIDDGRGLCV